MSSSQLHQSTDGNPCHRRSLPGTSRGRKLREIKVTQAGADLGFYKGGCPIHLKGATEVEHSRVYAFPEIFIDTVTALMTCFEHIFFSKTAT